jgi:hypothetical protein
MKKINAVRNTLRTLLHKFFSYTNILLILVILVASNCRDSKKDQNPNRTNEAASSPGIISEWTIMVFMNGDNNLEPDALADFAEIAAIGSNDEVNIIVQMDLIGKYVMNAWTQTLRFRITKDMPPLPKNAIMDIGEANMGDQKVLQDFVTWSLSKYPAKKFALVVWDHGQGYRLMLANQKMSGDLEKQIFNTTVDPSGSFSAVLDSMREAIEDKNINITVGDPFRSCSQSPFKSCSNDETSDDELFNSEIQEALIQSLNKKKLDVLGFDACLMGMIETAYAMRNVSKNLVGSEELEPGSGWQYNDWLGKLMAQPSMDGQQLSKVLVDSYANISSYYSNNTLAGTDITEFDDVALKISSFANTLKNSLHTDLPAIIAARKECSVYAPDPYHEPIPKDYFFHIDFIRFCDQIIQKTKNVQLKTDAERARNAVSKSIIGNFRSESRAGKFGSNGLAIYFPESDKQYKSDIFEQNGYKKNNTYYPVEFVQKQAWADFLHAYFLKVPTL